jgi:hypothetical protein
MRVEPKITAIDGEYPSKGSGTSVVVTGEVFQSLGVGRTGGDAIGGDTMGLEYRDES